MTDLNGTLMKPNNRLTTSLNPEQGEQENNSQISVKYSLVEGSERMNELR